MDNVLREVSATATPPPFPREESSAERSVGKEIASKRERERDRQRARESARNVPDLRCDAV